MSEKRPAVVPERTITEVDDGALMVSKEHQALGDTDDAFRATLGKTTLPIDAQSDRRIRRKVDWMLMPILCTVYGINFLDKITLSYASVTGFQKSINLVGDNYQWLGSIFYIGYLAAEYPAAYLLQRLPLAKYSGGMIVIWGTILSCFAAVENFRGAVAIRLLLGIFEAAVSPGWTLFMSQWYTKEEQATRTAWWISANGWAQIFGGAVAYGIARGADHHHYDLAPWKIIYLLAGLLTIVLGVVFLVVVPDNPLKAWWLAYDDRVLALERIRANQQGIGTRKFKSYQMREAFSDPKTWAFCLLAVAVCIPNGGLTNFFSLLIVSFHYTAEQSLLYGCVSGAIEIVACLGWAYLVYLSGNRILCGIAGMLLSLLGSILLVALPLSDSKGKLAGFYLAQFFITGVLTVISMLATNVAGYTKKTTVAALFFIFYCAGNIIGPQTFRPSQAPRYLGAETAIIVCFGVCILDLMFLYFYLDRQNKSKAKRRAEASYQKLENHEFLDLTDQENLEFVYVL